ncbi:MAG TPA: stage II sporulation protein M [Gemmataceae bacterium]|nr:stage II sporulation protein M [Gemmataceae bacterium]
MAEAADRPHGPEPAATNTASAEERVSTQLQPLGTPGGEVGTVAPPVTETYRPLSLLALAGFGIAVIYALVVLIGAAVALFNHIPWLMPSWTFLLPVAALVLCWAARLRIDGSEGTLSGLAFAAWGMRLAIVVGLTYTAYYGATFFAVRGKAVDCADSFFEYLKKGQTDQAFLLTQGIPIKDMESADRRNMLEARFNAPEGAASVGKLTRFRQAQVVRYIEMGGAETNIALQGVSKWEHDKDGYRVVLRYHIHTPLGDFDTSLATFGRDSKPGEPKGGQWQVDLTGSEMVIPPQAMKRTPHGEEVLQKLRMAEQLASSWAEKIDTQQWAAAYLDTLRSSERAGLSKQELRKGLEKLVSGELIRIDDERFWAGKQQKDNIKRRIRKSFQPGRPTVQLNLAKVMPLVRESEDGTTVLFDVNLLYLDETTGKPQYTVEGKLLVTAQEPDAASSVSAWRVEAVDVESGRTPPESSRPRRRD